jgi:putative transposase
MEIGIPYYYTATITKWHRLLRLDKYKDVIISSLQYLVEKKKSKYLLL